MNIDFWNLFEICYLLLLLLIFRTFVQNSNDQMSDRFSIVPFRQLVQITLKQLDSKKSFFGIPQEVFFMPNSNQSLQLKIYGKKLETPIGVAAGPHTQLSQNIVASWLCGARFIELKTVQTLDELDVSKPCIDMQDEGYNCEWSQELKIHQSFNQYLDAWILIHILKDKLGIGDDKEPGMIFNMSVGYDYAGIMNENVQWFFEKMADASVELKQKIEEIKNIYPNVINLNIPAQLSDNITLSTMHGCPPEEIEQIGAYLITKRKIHTTIKLNPTLLGKEGLRKIIKNSGFDTYVPDIAFEHDLKYEDAIPMLKRLQKKADENKVDFGIKLTNTLESNNHKDVFPPNEKMMYASGRVLHPISINIARKIQNEFSGEMSISFSGGADAFNITNIISSGLYPATVCSDLLKPGGYGRLAQYVENIRAKYLGETLIRNTENKKLFLSNLNQYAKEVLEDDTYKKVRIEDKSIKTNRPLDTFDCIHAPCVDTCPTSQGIPDYMYHTANGDFNKAFDVISKTNPFPNTTGMVCDHICQTKCTRINYDQTLLIREIKRFVTENASNADSKLVNNKLFLQKSVGIIGAGPAGLSAARFLKEAGFEVDVYEEKQKPGGMVHSAIPAFRIEESSIAYDVKRIQDLGVNIHYGVKIDKVLFAKIKDENDYVFIAAGAQKAKDVYLDGAASIGVFNPLEFLYEAKKNTKLKIGKDALIIGGGNTAMDAARTAKRLVRKEGSVKVVYRRTIKQMPADFDEILGVLDDDIEVMELVSPIKINAISIAIGRKVVSITCEKMKLGEKGADGRARPIPIPNSKFDIKADAIIPAFGQDVVLDFIDKDLLKTKPNSYEIQLENVFIGGDAMRGGATIIEAIGDARKVAEEIIERATKIKPDYDKSLYQKNVTTRALKIKKTKKEYSQATYDAPDANTSNFKIISVSLTKEQAMEEASRCLLCDEICDVCTSVCPNLALYPYEIEPIVFNLQKLVFKNDKVVVIDDETFEVSQKDQILHLADWCNECGNCDTFCPSAGAPYKVKPHLHLDYTTFLDSNDVCYFYKPEEKQLYLKVNKQISSLMRKDDEYHFKINKNNIALDAKTFKIKSHNLVKQDVNKIDFKAAAEMSIILQGAEQLLNI